jgi:uncharacterized membrane protein YfcA
MASMEFVADQWQLIVGGGFLIGFLIGITGVGAGSLTTPLLITGIGVPPAIAVGTDLLFASITKASAAWRHQRLGNVDWPILGWLAAGSTPGALLMIAMLSLAQSDAHALAAYIRQILSIALVVSSIAINSTLRYTSPCDPFRHSRSGSFSAPWSPSHRWAPARSASPC